MPWKKEPQAPKKKHESVIIAELEDTWLEITESQRLD